MSDPEQEMIDIEQGPVYNAVEIKTQRMDDEVKAREEQKSRVYYSHLEYLKKDGSTGIVEVGKVRTLAVIPHKFERDKNGYFGINICIPLRLNEEQSEQFMANMTGNTNFLDGGMPSVLHGFYKGLPVAIPLNIIEGNGYCKMHQSSCLFAMISPRILTTLAWEADG